MTLLAIETSCDETGAAIVQDGRVRSNCVASQAELHADYGGVVPELATRAHLRTLLPVIRAALTSAAVGVGQLDAVAATQGPGLPGALMVGFKAGQALAFARRCPFLGIHHHEAHLYSPWVAGDPLAVDFACFRPSVALIVSGGHTLLVQVRAEFEHRVLGSTRDDAGGECFDKTAKMLGLAYPGGPEMERLAEGGNPRAFAFPRPLLQDAGEDFSFSGLKTAVRYFLREHPEAPSDRQGLRDLCASVQAAILEVLVTKTVRAAERLGVDCVAASGGVTRNRVFRRELAGACARRGWTLRLAPDALCTDNAAMIGILAERKLLRRCPLTGIDAEIKPGWPLA